MRRTRSLGIAAALLGVLAFVLSWAAPMEAMASGAQGPGIEICTGAGIEIVHPDGDGAGHADHATCGHCCLSAPAVQAPIAPKIAPAAFALTQIYVGVSVAAPPLGARAPPRPPGQAPPQS